MLILYQTGSSPEIELLEEHHQAQWELVKRQAVRYLRLKSESTCAKVLEEGSFSLWSGTNSFGDRFELLYAQVPMERYLELEREVDSGQRDWLYGEIADALQGTSNTPIRFIAVDAECEEGHPVPTPTLKITSSTVERALSDLEALLTKGGAVSGVDRVHTALHGYLRAVCTQASISFKEDADITTLFKLIREQHPMLQASPPGWESVRVVRALAQVVDAMNPVRNHKSLAHPNEELLEEPEARLVVNSVRTLLHYLNAKLR